MVDGGEKRWSGRAELKEEERKEAFGGGCGRRIEEKGAGCVAVGSLRGL